MAKGEKNDYINEGEIGLLWIEPENGCSLEPVIDELTKKMTAAFRKSITNGRSYRGCHQCVCGAYSGNREHYLGNIVLNTLCIHYLAYHRDEVPTSDLERVKNLNYGEEMPNDDELASPKKEPEQERTYR